ncbi:hypothetical protein B0H10DRAFT_2206501 [Mycena sp. CBHHK59/15]|nr:hypothetical protein B0H10DRAFT_2206501 [Mycena sp. CBHHK59/15]
MAANAALLNGSLTSINLGNTGVSTFQTKVVDVLLISTMTQVAIATDNAVFWLSIVWVLLLENHQNIL